MSKMSNAVKSNRISASAKGKPVVNFMNGISYELNPLDTLKIVSASSIFGEPQYYRAGEVYDGKVSINKCFEPYVCSFLKDYEGEKTSDVMEKVIDAALAYDFKGTLDWAVELRKNYLMRLNPQVIMVRAAIHPARTEFSNKYPGLFVKYNNEVMSRADEPATQLTYYLYKNKTKNSLPNILKKSWARKYEGMSVYDIYKYRNKGIGMIDTIRVCHAHSPIISDLLRGNLVVDENNKTWETLRSQGKSWIEILNTIKIGHMALLRNLRGIFTEVGENDFDTTKKVLDNLKKGVKSGKQFPFRYLSAYNMIERSNVTHKQAILDALEECMDIACDNMPKLKGRTMCLSDNSGSAWGTLSSEYGTVRVAEIDNLSSVIAAHNSDEGFVGKFGDELNVFSISKRKGVLEQTKEVNETRRVGGGTENGIWIFFRDAIDKGEVYDNIFIFSDQQAGHGGLYGTSSGTNEYTSRGFGVGNSFGYGRYVDVAKLIAEYRKQVNPRVNVFTIQTAGYTNVLIPENGYRTSVLYGWTGKELVYADAINKFWDSKDTQRYRKNQ